jgi:hypothetical protein
MAQDVTRVSDMTAVSVLCSDRKLSNVYLFVHESICIPNYYAQQSVNLNNGVASHDGRVHWMYVLAVSRCFCSIRCFRWEQKAS